MKSTHQEPVREPLEEEPSPGEGALRASFDDLVEAVPKRSLKFAQIESEAWPWFRQAVEAGVVSAAVLIGCARRMATDPELKGRRYLPPLETWLAEGQWRSWLPDPELALDEPAAPGQPDPSLDDGATAAWLATMAEMQTLMGPASFGAWLSRARLDQIGEALFVVAFSGPGVDWLKANRWSDLTAAWARRDARPLALISKSEFEALLRKGTT